MHSQMAKFYNNVIDDFITFVEKQYKGKSSMIGEDIEQMKKTLKSKIKNTQSFNKKIINNFFDESISFAQQPKVKEVKKNEIPVKLQQNGPLQLNIINRKKSNSQEQEDDLNQFKKPKNSKHQQKQTSKQVAESLKFNEDELFEFNSGDQDEKLNINELNSIKQQTGLHILGSYNTKQKKFHSKKEQTRFTVYNAFLKIQGYDQEVLFPVVQLVTKRASKTKILI